MTPRSCGICGSTFRPKTPRVNAGRQLCYSCVPGAGSAANCLACGVAFIRNKGTQFACSRSCKKKIAPVTRVAYADCSVCGRLLAVHGSALSRLTELGRTQCPGECRDEAIREKSRRYQAANYERHGKPAARRNTAKRRARLVGAEVTEAVDVQVLIVRDCGICHLCDEPVRADLAWPDPRSPSIDHVTPVSLGGDHSYANTALAHLGCNARKGNRVALVS